MTQDSKKILQAQKVNMTQLFLQDGRVMPVTVLSVKHDQTAVKVSDFERGDVVDIKGTSKGRGFAGAMKRHGFHGAPASHGHDHPRAVGSIGQRYPQHTRKGLRMAGHMGNKNATVKHSMIVGIDADKGLIFVKGGVPGAPTSHVRVIATGLRKDLPEIVKYGEDIQNVKIESIPVPDQAETTTPPASSDNNLSDITQNTDQIQGDSHA